MDGRNLARAPKRLNECFIVKAMKQITHDILTGVFSGLQSFNTCCAQAVIHCILFLCLRCLICYSVVCAVNVPLLAL